MSTLENNRSELPISTFQASNGLGAQENVVFLKLEHRLRADLGSITADYHVGHPVLHHDGKLRPSIPLPICRYRLPRIFETVAVKTVMHGNPVEGFEAGKFGELVNEPGRKKDLRSRAVRPVRAYEIKRLAGRNDIGYPRPAYLDGFIAGEFLQRFAKEIRRRPPFSSEQAMDGVGAQIALAALIAEQRPPVAPSQDERGTEASRPAADNENIELH